MPVAHIRTPFLCFHLFYFLFVLSLFLALVYITKSPDAASENNWICYWTWLLLFCPVLFYCSINLFWFFRLHFVFNNTVLAIRPLYRYIFLSSQVILVLCESVLILTGGIHGNSSGNGSCWLPLRSVDFVFNKSPYPNYPSFLLCGRFNKDVIKAMIALGGVVMPASIAFLSSQYIYRLYHITRVRMNNMNLEPADSGSTEKGKVYTLEKISKEMPLEWSLAFQRSFAVAFCAVISSLITFVTAIISFSNGVIFMCIDGFISGTCMLCIFPFGDFVYQCMCKILTCPNVAKRLLHKIKAAINVCTYTKNSLPFSQTGGSLSHNQREVPKNKSIYKAKQKKEKEKQNKLKQTITGNDKHQK
ncbi:hypothetical protein RFI_16353 [Reticulomyxa filosa]|uniref:Uncharacterized protein n=1 Tax=Reticulomyxa filosa TaxID=46433 RepID=X6N4B9_RETFI|nr:hypothetical protein RFI_16353 [Reticulomyxa filosa]|eukprot:ETO20856.1 hypothetical protein RFI_16353 [Reticulomyxa filosa]